MSIPKIEDAAQFLYETGLLAEVNRKVLHPLGLALPVHVEEDGSARFEDHLYDFRKDPAGMHFDKEALAEIRRKLESAPVVSEERLRLYPNSGIQPLSPAAEEVLKSLRDD